MLGSMKRSAYVGIAVVLAWSALDGVRARAQEGGVVAREAWVPVPLPSNDGTALFVVLENHTASGRAVVAVSSDAANKAEMHEMKMDGKMMSMSPVQEIRIPANGKTELRPGGLHVMLFGLKSRPAVGDAVRATLTLDDGSTVPVTATVRKP